MNDHRDIPPGPRFPVEKAIVYFILGYFFLFLTIVPSFVESVNRAKIAKAKSELRNLAVSLEYYYIDFQVYPPGSYYTGDLSEQTQMVPDYITELASDAGLLKMYLKRNTYKTVWIIFGAGWIVAVLVLFYLSHWRRWFGCAALAGLSFYVLLRVYWSFDKDFGGDQFAVLFPLFVSSVYSLVWAGKNWNPGCVVGEKVRALYLPILFAGWLTTVLISSAVVKYQCKGIDYISYQYATDGVGGWILQSSGPDGDYDLALPTIFEATSTAGPKYILTGEEMEDKTKSFTYDPTNGLFSSGDILRFGP